MLALVLAPVEAELEAEVEAELEAEVEAEVEADGVGGTFATGVALPQAKGSPATTSRTAVAALDMPRWY